MLSLPGKLSEEVAEGGDNFSTGQRQVREIAKKKEKERKRYVYIYRERDRIKERREE